MYIKQLKLIHFRNYAELDLNWGEGINCLFGKNGSGKTNLLDAIHFQALTRSFRTNQDKQAVQTNESFFLTEGRWQNQAKTFKVQCNFVKGKGKRILIDQQPVKRMSEHIGTIPLVAILPHDTELITDASSIRRRFLDMLISQYNKEYLQHLIQYERILSQRNALLKSFVQQSYDPEQLMLWDEQIIPHGIAIYKGRSEFIEEFRPLFTTYFHHIVSASEDPAIRYISQLKENSSEAWRALFDERREKDRQQLYTTGGIHRDDLKFEINQHSVRDYGSQGQQKTFAIALKMAQYILLSRHTNLGPVLLLDDIFDKLDENRLGQIANILDQEIDGQVFITDTTLERLKSVFSHVKNKSVSYFRVSEAKVSPY